MLRQLTRPPTLNARSWLELALCWQWKGERKMSHVVWLCSTGPFRLLHSGDPLLSFPHFWQGTACSDEGYGVRAEHAAMVDRCGSIKMPSVEHSARVKNHSWQHRRWSGLLLSIKLESNEWTICKQVAMAASTQVESDLDRGRHVSYQKWHAVTSGDMDALFYGMWAKVGLNTKTKREMTAGPASMKTRCNELPLACGFW